MHSSPPSQAIPFHTNGMRIGLLGGSFNPPHAAHRAHQPVRAEAPAARPRLVAGDAGQSAEGHQRAARRSASARTLRATVADDPRIDVSCLEAVIGTRYTVDTIMHLRRRVSGVRFVWIMGADNLAQFHRWQDWRRIAAEVPIAVIDRPPQSFRALAAPAAQALARYRLPRIRRPRPADQHAPAWVFLTGMKLNLSSTGLRNPDGSWKTKK